MAEITDKLLGYFDFSGIGSLFGFLMLLVILVIIIVVGIYFISRFKQYKFKITIFENLAGSGWVPTSKDRARLMKSGDGGEEVLYLMKRKIYKPAYGQRIGKNHYAFAIGNDGLWYNIIFSDLNSEMSVLGIKPVDPVMRQWNVSIRRNAKDRFDKSSWLKENIGLIFGIGAIIIVLIFMWLIFREFSSITGGAERAVEASAKVVEATERLLSGLDNVVSNSGVNPI